MILDKQASLFRLKAHPSDADVEYWQQELVSFRLNVQPESAEYQALTGDTFGRTSRVFTTQSGIRINDKIVISGSLTYSGMEYIVKGVADWNFPPLPHYEIRVAEGGA
jgi:hypothetical protein